MAVGEGDMASPAIAHNHPTCTEAQTENNQTENKLPVGAPILVQESCFIIGASEEGFDFGLPGMI